MRQICRIAWKKSRKPFEKFNGIFSACASVISVAVVIHSITKDWGDNMMWWALAGPGFVWWIYFVWNIIKLHHKFRKDRTPAVLTCLLFICAALIVIFFVQMSEIARLNKKLVPKLASNPKPLPMTAIPAAESPPPVTPQQPEQPAPIVFEADVMPTNGGDALAKIQAQQKEQELESEADANKRLHDYWTNALPYYDQTILTLRDSLNQLAAKESEAAETYPPPVQFLQCLPRSISAAYEDRTIGEIKLSKNTNMDFKVSIMSESDEQRLLKISCDSGYFIVHPYGGYFYWRLKTVGVKDSETRYPPEEVRQRIAEGINALIDGQQSYLTPTNQ